MAKSSVSMGAFSPGGTPSGMRYPPSMRAWLVASWVLLALPASADVAPPNQCSKAGEACDTAGPQYKSRGVCVADTCSKTLNGPNGPQTHAYACNFCLLPEEASKKGAPAA